MIIYPNFFVVGAQKAGTTSIYDILATHPEVFVCKKKETRFFNFHYRKGFEWYLKTYFNTSQNNYLAIGEVNPGYLYATNVPNRIKTHLGKNIKIIIILRDPAKRAFSQFVMDNKVKGSKTSKSLKNDFINQLSDEFSNIKESNYIRNSNYSESIKRYIKSFGINNIKVIIFEEYIGFEKKEILCDLFDFLGVSKTSFNFDINYKSNASSFPRVNLFKFVYSKNLIVKFLRKILNYFPTLKNILRNIFTARPSIPDDYYFKTLNHKYFINDILEVEKLLKEKIKYWSH